MGMNLNTLKKFGQFSMRHKKPMAYLVGSLIVLKVVFGLSILDILPF
jgi:hypothetical protein